MAGYDASVSGPSSSFSASRRLKCLEVALLPAKRAAEAISVQGRSPIVPVSAFMLTEEPSSTRGDARQRAEERRQGETLPPDAQEAGQVVDQIEGQVHETAP